MTAAPIPRPRLPRAIAAAAALLLGLGGALVVASPAAAAASYVVTDPSGDAAVPGSFGEAVADAEASPDASTISFDPSVTGTITLLADLPQITHDLVIDGPGSTVLTIETPGTVFDIAGPVTVSLDGLTLASAGANAFGVLADDADLTLTDIVASGFDELGVSATDGGLVATDVTADGNGDGGIDFFGGTGDALALTRVTADGNLGFGVGISAVVDSASATLDTVSTGSNADVGMTIVVTNGTLTASHLAATDNVGSGIDLQLDDHSTGTVSDATSTLNDGYGMTLASVSDSSLEISDSTADANTSAGFFTMSTLASSLTFTGVTATNNQADGIVVLATATATITVQGSRSEHNGFGCGCGGPGLTIQADDSTVLVSDTSLLDNHGFFGGGLSVPTLTGGSTMIVSSTTIDGNSALGGSPDGYGGGIGVDFFADAGTTMTVQDSTITDNHADTDGGGVYFTTIGGGSTTGGVSFVRTTIDGNDTPGDGGGILVDGMDDAGGAALLTIDSSTVSNNTATGNGGGVLLYKDALDSPDLALVSIIASTLSTNHAFNGGGLYIEATSAPAGSFAVQLAHSTVAANTATIIAGVIVEGTAVSLDFDHALIADNTNADLSFDPAIEPSTFAYNLVEDPLVGVVLPAIDGNIVGIDPDLGPLALNGGTTKTHLVSPGSAAYNAGDPAFAGAGLFDQRGLPRVYQVVDIGAVEWQPALAYTGQTVTPGPSLVGLLLLLCGVAMVAFSRLQLARSAR